MLTLPNRAGWSHEASNPASHHNLLILDNSEHHSSMRGAFKNKKVYGLPDGNLMIEALREDFALIELSSLFHPR